MRKTLEVWLPTLFCAFLSLTALILLIKEQPTFWAISFLAFLPICFLFIGSSMRQMYKEILTLRQQIIELEKSSSEIKNVQESVS